VKMIRIATSQILESRSIGYHHIILISVFNLTTTPGQ
jgi:hypothetical protein